MERQRSWIPESSYVVFNIGWLDAVRAVDVAPGFPLLSCMRLTAVCSFLSALSCGRSGGSEDVLFQLFCCQLIYAFRDEYGVAFRLDDDRAVLGEPGALAGCFFQSVGLDTGIFPIFRDVVYVRIALGDCLGIDRGKLGGLFGVRPARHVQ